MVHCILISWKTHFRDFGFLRNCTSNWIGICHRGQIRNNHVQSKGEQGVTCTEQFSKLIPGPLCSAGTRQGMIVISGKRLHAHIVEPYDIKALQVGVLEAYATLITLSCAQPQCHTLHWTAQAELGIKQPWRVALHPHKLDTLGQKQWHENQMISWTWSCTQPCRILLLDDGNLIVVWYMSVSGDLRDWLKNNYSWIYIDIDQLVLLLWPRLYEVNTPMKLPSRSWSSIWYTTKKALQCCGPRRQYSWPHSIAHWDNQSSFKPYCATVWDFWCF